MCPLLLPRSSLFCFISSPPRAMMCSCLYSCLLFTLSSVALHPERFTHYSSTIHHRLLCTLFFPVSTHHTFLFTQYAPRSTSVLCGLGTKASRQASDLPDDNRGKPSYYSHARKFVPGARVFFSLKNESPGPQIVTWTKRVINTLHSRPGGVS